jgi:hypothetical protein
VLLAAVAVHAGFQMTVTTLVHPALFCAPDWDSAHAAHSRAITPLVVLVYGAVVAASVWLLVEGVDHTGTWVVLGGVAVSLAATAFRAAPLHGRLSSGRDATLLRSLRQADLVRSFGAVLALAARRVRSLPARLRAPCGRLVRGSLDGH